jgi:hypothetical protein
MKLMGKTTEYQGYTIQSTPHYETEWKKWRLRIVVSAEDFRGVQTREFSSEILYATEQEAEIHGIAFGQRLIDGKLIGSSVADMKTTDRRVTPRLPVRFRTTFSDFRRLGGVGAMLDLSLGGCRIESPVIVELGVSLELRIYAPDIEWPLIVNAASVQWVSGQTFGLAFFWITDAKKQRLGRIIDDLRMD